MYWLFDTDGFAPRSMCGMAWTPEKILADQFGNLMVFVAYVAMPMILVATYIWFRKKLKSPGVATVFNGFPRWSLLIFAAFILSCGVGHLWGMLVFRWPAYNLFIAWDILTGVISLVAVYALWRAFRWLIWQFLELTKRRSELLIELDSAVKLAESRGKKILDEYEARGRQNEKLSRDLDELRSVAVDVQKTVDVKTAQKIEEIRELIHKARDHMQ